MQIKPPNDSPLHERFSMLGTAASDALDIHRTLPTPARAASAADETRAALGMCAAPVFAGYP